MHSTTNNLGNYKVKADESHKYNCMDIGCISMDALTCATELFRLFEQGIKNIGFVPNIKADMLRTLFFDIDKYNYNTDVLIAAIKKYIMQLYPIEITSTNIITHNENNQMIFR